jgi:hypothetical protein
LAIVVFIALIAFTIISLTQLTSLQDEGAMRAEDAIMVTEVAGTAPVLYQIIADGVINRDLEATIDQWAEIRAEMDGDTQAVAKAVDTPEEVEWSNAGIAAYRAFAALFENGMLPLLQSGTDLSAEIRAVDGSLDEQMG